MRSSASSPRSSEDPFWALGVFALCVIVIHGFVVYDQAERGERQTNSESLPDEAASGPGSYSTQGS